MVYYSYSTDSAIPDWMLNGLGFAALLVLVVVLRTVMVRRRREQYERIRRAFQGPATPPPLPLAVRCLRCGAPVTPEATFCGRCGQPTPARPAFGAAYPPGPPARPSASLFYIVVVLLALVGFAALLFLSHRGPDAPAGFAGADPRSNAAGPVVRACNPKGAKGAKTDAKENAATLVFFLLTFSSSRRREEPARAKAPSSQAAPRKKGVSGDPSFLGTLGYWRLWRLCFFLRASLRAFAVRRRCGVEMQLH